MEIGVRRDPTGRTGALVAEAGTHDSGKRSNELLLAHLRLVRKRLDAHPPLVLLVERLLAS